MRLFVGLTDGGWVERVRALGPGDAYLWRPHQRVFRALAPGEPFLFKLHAPRDAIVGAGRFVEARRLPLSLAWLAFGPSNGVADPQAFRRRVERAHPGEAGADPVLSGVVLDHPTFLAEADWVPVPAGWRPSVAHGKVYDGAAGRALWATVQERLGAAGTTWGAGDAPLGPGRLRLQVAEAYGRRCAITGEHALATLDVGHLVPPSQGGPERADNALLLRADLARLLQHGLLTVEPDGFVVRVGAAVRATYGALDGRALKVVPERFDLLPGREYLEAHRANAYRA